MYCISLQDVYKVKPDQLQSLCALHVSKSPEVLAQIAAVGRNLTALTLSTAGRLIVPIGGGAYVSRASWLLVCQGISLAIADEVLACVAAFPLHLASGGPVQCKAVTFVQCEEYGPHHLQHKQVLQVHVVLYTSIRWPRPGKGEPVM